jgi:hypothetical protein
MLQTEGRLPADVDNVRRPEDALTVTPFYLTRNWRNRVRLRLHCLLPMCYNVVGILRPGNYQRGANDV